MVPSARCINIHASEHASAETPSASELLDHGEQQDDEGREI
jgi:hypothetical protein